MSNPHPPLTLTPLRSPRHNRHIPPFQSSMTSLHPIVLVSNNFAPRLPCNHTVIIRSDPISNKHDLPSAQRPSAKTCPRTSDEITQVNAKASQTMSLGGGAVSGSDAWARGRLELWRVAGADMGQDCEDSCAFRTCG